MGNEKLDKIKKLMKEANMETDPTKVFNNKAFQNVSKMMGVEQKKQVKPTKEHGSMHDMPTGGGINYAKPVKPMGRTGNRVPTKEQDGFKYISAVHFLNEHANDIGYTNTVIKEYKSKFNEMINSLTKLREDMEKKFNLPKEANAFLESKLNDVFDEIKSITGKSREENKQVEKRKIVPKEEKRILIIENSITQRTLIKSKLDELGYKYIAEEKNGQKGLETIIDHYAGDDEGSIDLIIMDLELPELSGRKIIQTLRTSDYSKDYPQLKVIPILIISNYKMTNPDGGELSKDQLNYLKLEQMEKPFKGDVFKNLVKKIFPEDYS